MLLKADQDQETCHYLLFLSLLYIHYLQISNTDIFPSLQMHINNYGEVQVKRAEDVKEATKIVSGSGELEPWEALRCQV